MAHNLCSKEIYRCNNKLLVINCFLPLLPGSSGCVSALPYIMMSRGRALVTDNTKNMDHSHTQDEQWQKLVAQISAVLASETGVELPEGEIAPLPFDAASDVPIDDQRWVLG